MEKVMVLFRQFWPFSTFTISLQWFSIVRWFYKTGTTMVIQQNHHGEIFSSPW